MPFLISEETLKAENLFTAKIKMGKKDENKVRAMGQNEVELRKNTVGMMLIQEGGKSVASLPIHLLNNIEK